MKSYVILFLIFFTAYFESHAQSNGDIRNVMAKEISRHTGWTSALDKRKPFAYFFALAVSYNDQGQIDTVYFTENLREDFQAILKPKELSVYLMNSKVLQGFYKSKVVMYPLIYRYQPDMIIPFDDLAMRDWLKLWPIFNVRDRTRQLVMLQPYHNTFYSVDN